LAASAVNPKVWDETAEDKTEGVAEDTERELKTSYYRRARVFCQHYLRLI